MWQKKHLYSSLYFKAKKELKEIQVNDTRFQEFIQAEKEENYHLKESNKQVGLIYFYQTFYINKSNFVLEQFSTELCLLMYVQQW